MAYQRVKNDPVKYAEHLAQGKLWKAAAKEKMKAGASEALELQ